MPRWISWKVGKNFGAWHITDDDQKTDCGVNVAQQQPSAVSHRTADQAPGTACRSCCINRLRKLAPR